ncbi:MAG: M60 family metallopeptidase [Bacteroidaceae bacterium]
MNTLHKTLITALLAISPLFASAQYMQHKEDSKKAERISISADTITLGYNNGITNLSVLSNCDYIVTNENTWFKILKDQRDMLTLFGSYNYDQMPHMGSFVLTSTSGKTVRNIVVKQEANTSSDDLTGDRRLKIASGEASQEQPGEGIKRTYDENINTLWHSPYSGTSFPITLDYTLSGDQHVDYMMYTPRQDGNGNGNFNVITVSYALASNPNNWVKLSDFDLKGSSSTERINFGENGLDNVSKIRITINSGTSNFASCAEMAFYQKDMETATLFANYFSDNLCSKLRDGVTTETLNEISHPYVKQLVYSMLNGNYSTKYRVGEFEAYRPVGELANDLRTSTYNRYENPTGIYFKKGEKLVLFVEGITDVEPKLIIKSFGPESYTGEGQPESSYSLKNGVNVITTTNRGNGYISYYTSSFATAPKIKIHFAMAKENGYFDMERGDTNKDWVELLKNACSDIIDVRTKRIQVAIPTATYKQTCPTKGRELAILYDSVIYREHEVMGLQQFGREPKNHQFARCVTGGMFADGVGAAAAYGSIGGWANPDNFDFWGFAHELGHTNQVRPGLKWVGCGETTNNIYSAWVNFTLGGKWLRLEDERTGVNDYGNLRGGRFNTYLEEGVRKGINWQLQDGPDYHGSGLTNVTVNGEDYDGNKTGSIATTKRNYDHFVKVVPLWQLLLYTQQAKKSVGAYGKVIEGIRNYNYTRMSNGKMQMLFMRNYCDSTGINFLPFFEKAGMLKPINTFIEDYSAEWLKINEKMISDLKAYVAAKNYPEPDAAINYINGYNWKVYRDNAKLVQATPNEGCTPKNGRIEVDNNVWKNVVAYETYDANDKLIRISMFGLGAEESSSRYTQVLWPTNSSEKSAYIMAVGFDGTRYKCYQPRP